MKLRFSVKGDLKLPPGHKDAWLTALRGDDYDQTKSVLHDTTGFCCLGVQCDVLGVKWIGSTASEVFATENASMQMPTFKELGHEILAVMQQKTTFHPDDDNEGTLDVMGALSWHNDKGSTFDEIADWIEIYL